MIYRRHYPCANCGNVGEKILNGHAVTATDWPDRFFCSLPCIDDYKATHPRWREEKAAKAIAVEHNCYMRQVAKKEDWERFAMTYNPESNTFRMSSIDYDYDSDDVVTLTEGFKKRIQAARAGSQEEGE